MWLHGLLGFFFGAAGIYMLAGLSLVSTYFEVIATPFLLPGRFAAAMFAGPDGSTIEVAFVTFFNGVLYTLVFMAFGAIFKRQRAY